LDQNFSATGPNQKWTGDISYIWTSEGWLYLAFVGKTMPHIAFCSASFLDLYSRRVIGWAVSNRMKRDLAIRALDMAVALRKPPKDCIHHTDRGSQYCSNEYQRRLKKHGFKVSMSGKGNCYDNSMVLRRENAPLGPFLTLLTFFKSIKAELIWRNKWDTRRQAEGAVCT
jgi:putative transposase